MGVGKKSDFTKSMTASPPATRYQIKNFLELSRNKGQSFGAARDKQPDNCYTVPQMQKVPGPKVLKNKYSTSRKNRREITTITPCDPKQLTLSKRKRPTAMLQAQGNTKQWICSPRTVGSVWVSILIIAFQSSTMDSVS